MSLLAIIMLSPVLLVLWILIPLDSPGPALFRQARVGRGGTEFRIRKFRSMTGSSGPSVSTSEDVRITRIGKVIRAAKLDELPQLVDVLQGRMSLVGPRPEVPQFVADWPRNLRPVILSVRPGITDPATVVLRSEADYLAQYDDPEQAYVEHLLPAKAMIYADYVRSRTFTGDLRIVWETFIAIIRPSDHPAIDIEGLVSRARSERP